MTAVHVTGKGGPMWFAAYLAAQSWGCPPWVIMGEPYSDWTAIKWLMRRGFVEGEMNRKKEMEHKKREAEARLSKRR